MARKKTTKRRSRGTKTASRNGGGGGKGRGLGAAFTGALAGAGGQVLGKLGWLGTWAQPAADLTTGYFMKNETLEVIGGRSVGAMLAAGVTIPGMAAGGSSTTGYAPVV